MCDCAAQVILGLGILCFVKLASEIEVVQQIMLFLMSRLHASAVSCSSFSACETVGEFDLVELALYGLAQG